MSKKNLHILLLMLLAFLITGCCAEPVPLKSDANITFTVRCMYPSLSKADQIDGVDTYNENLILSVDFLFYPGAKPNPETEADDYAAYCSQQAVHHVRKELSKGDNGESEFSFSVKKDAMKRIFPEGGDNKATVYALVNFDSSFIGQQEGTSLNQLAHARIQTDFPATENDFIQPKFLMDGECEITYHEDIDPNVEKEIWVKRFATKLTLAVHVAKQAKLEHLDKNDGSPVPDETWTPVLSSMRIYLVDGYKSYIIGGYEDEGAEADKYLSYKDKMRSYIKDDGTPYMTAEVLEGEGSEEDRTYYNTYPMYTYPGKWSNKKWDYSQADFSQSLPHEQPYIKLEMDWRRNEDENYSYDRRKYYYKVFMPFPIDSQGYSEFIRNNWYGLYLNLSILGSTTDEGMVSLTPSVYLLDWQNKTTTINKFAVISKARYLSLEKTEWNITNLSTLSIPFISSHDVVTTGKVTATRPYYGDITDSEHPLDSYHTGFHAWIKGDATNGYYLQYHDQPEGYEAYEPALWIKPQSTSVLLDHQLQNDYTKAGFDYSPYTINFRIVHSDLADDPSTYTYSQYTRSITVTQYPAIYIEATRNSDTKPIQISGKLHGYPDPPYPQYREGIDNPQVNAPWEYMPWGYVYVNGGRFVRWDYDPNSKTDPYYKLSTNEKKEYQWQTVYYSGGSKDIFNIHVSVLPSTTAAADFVIGDPRKAEVDNLYNEFTVENNDHLAILEHIEEGTQYELDEEDGKYKRKGFNAAPALYGDSPRRLMYYHPTETNSVISENMIAPSYRISSKFGGTEYGNLTKQYAEYRCAGYQEDGFPAGRWRLPTEAEVTFIAQLSANKAFEVLFNFGGIYWSANKAIKINDSGSVSSVSTDTALLRCVYDSWYWDPLDLEEGKTEKGEPRLSKRDQFIWGDKE